MKVVLFCGGLGLRMREDQRPTVKPMTTIGGRPLLWHVMRYYAHYGHTDFVLCLGYGATSIKNYFLRYDETDSNDFTLHGTGRDVRLLSTDVSNWRITFVDTGPAASIGERLLRVRHHLDGEPLFLANYADTLTDADLPAMVDRMRCADAAMSLMVVPPASTHHVVDADADGRVTRVVAMSDVRRWENAGYFVLRPEVFDALSTGGDLVPDAVNRLADRGRVLAQPHQGFWRAVDTFKDRTDLEDRYLRGDCPWMVWTVAG
jgi:glucose-1-phosphate cytidylyltransferase